MSKKAKTPPPAVPSLKLLAQKGEGVTRSEFFRVDPDLIIFESGFNVRTADDSLKAHQERLYQAMKAGASVPPIDVRVDNGLIICVEGHSRTLAARRLKKEVPEYTLEARQFRGNEQERTLHMLGTGSGQKPLTPLEQGMGYLRLVKYGLTPPDIAARLGVSRVTVDNGLVLAEAPVEVQKLIREGKVSSTTAREAVKQGLEAIKALIETGNAPEAPEPETQPAAGKPAAKSKKKKVTAAKLKGTPAEKKKSTKAKKKKPADTTGDEDMVVGEDEVLLKVKKVHLQTAVDALKAPGMPENDENLNLFIAASELALI